MSRAFPTPLRRLTLGRLLGTKLLIYDVRYSVANGGYRRAADMPKSTRMTRSLRSARLISKGRDRKDLPLETRIQFSHLHANALKFRACGARREVRVACGYVGEGALPSDIRLAAVTARMFDEYFTGWKPDREAHGGSLASYIEDLGGQTRLGVVLCAFDYPDGASRGDLPCPSTATGDAIGRAAVPAARCRKVRRGSFMASSP